MAAVEGKPLLYLVDGYNVLHAVVLAGKDRSEWHGPRNRAQVVELAGRLREGEAWVVFDGSVVPEELGRQPERVTVSFAPSADDFILERCVALRGDREIVVVSADRSLLDRARHRGAARLSPWQFAGLCKTQR